MEIYEPIDATSCIDMLEFGPFLGFLLEEHGRGVRNVPGNRRCHTGRVPGAECSHDVSVVIKALLRGSRGRNRAHPCAQDEIPLLLQKLGRLRIASPRKQRAMEVAVCSQDDLRITRISCRSERRVRSLYGCLTLGRFQVCRPPRHRHLEHQADLENFKQRLDRGVQDPRTAVGNDLDETPTAQFQQGLADRCPRYSNLTPQFRGGIQLARDQITADDRCPDRLDSLVGQGQGAIGCLHPSSMPSRPQAHPITEKENASS